MIRARIPSGLFGGEVTTSDTPPASPSDGDLWWHSVLGKLFVWYLDPDGGQWVPATPSIPGPPGPAGTPGGPAGPAGPAGPTGPPSTARTAIFHYYVATTGSDANDGLTAGTPVLTFQKAVDLCAATAAYSSGPFTINVAAGTYTVPALLSFTTWLFVGSPLTIKGHLSGGVPDAIVQGSATGTRPHNFLNISGGGVSVTLQDIFFRSFVQPISITQFARGSMVNCWVRNVANVMAGGNGGYIGAFGGDWDGRDMSGVMVPSATGLSSVIVSPFNLDQANDYTGLLIHHWDRGVAISEGCSGHMRFLRIEDCDAGIEMIRGAPGPNMSGVRIWRCATGIRSMAGGPLFIGDDADFGQGTANACGTNIVHTSSPAMQQQEGTDYSTRPEFIAFSKLNGANLTNMTTERDVWNPAIYIVRGRPRAGDTLDIHMHNNGILTTVGTLRLYFGATLVKAWTLPVGTTDSRIEITLEAVNGTDWRGQIYTLAGPAATPAPSLAQIVTTTGLTSLVADTQVKLTWQAGALVDYLQMHIGRLYSSVAGLRST